MTTKPIGLYIHIPFCVKKCNYCDFCSFKVDDVEWRTAYIEALCREIKSYSGKNISVETIFFGGGTPSLLTVEEFGRIVLRIRESFTVLPNVEFTIEANPKTLTKEKLSAFINLGVNRLSIGLQSIHKNEQKLLGRIHDYEDFLVIYKMARELGIKNINVDLMYGIPEQTIKSFRETLDTVSSLNPEHISLYGLILEEGTPFYQIQDELNRPSEDVECDMYYLATAYLSKAGYKHYEISNYARDGYSCRHNLKYWRAEEYIGIGLAAHSYFNSIRFSNTSDATSYITDSFSRYNKGEFIDIDSKAYEYVMLSLRLSEGFSLTDYKERFGRDFTKGREDILNRLCNNHLIEMTENRIALTEKGFYVSNNILTELL